MRRHTALIGLVGALTLSLVGVAALALRGRTPVATAAVPPSEDGSSRTIVPDAGRKKRRREQQDVEFRVDPNDASARIVVPTPPPPPPAPGQWIATEVDIDDLDLGSFAVVSQPTPEHAGGVVAALGYVTSDTDVLDEFLVRIEVASATEISRTQLGSLRPRWITTTTGAIVLGTQTETGYELSFFGFDGKPVRASKLLAGLGVGGEERNAWVRALNGFGDRLVIVTGGGSGWDRSGGPTAPDTVTVHLLDSEGTELASHTCKGGLFNPGNAWLAQTGDMVLVANLLPEQEKDAARPLCGLHLHGAPRWREGLARGSGVSQVVSVHEEDGKVYVEAPDSRWHALNEEMRAGPVVEPTFAEQPSCWGLIGTGIAQSAALGEARVVQTSACCGDTEAGLFICRPPRGDAGRAP
jgi:hypothetical protein